MFEPDSDSKLKQELAACQSIATISSPLFQNSLTLSEFVCWRLDLYQIYISKLKKCLMLVIEWAEAILNMALFELKQPVSGTGVLQRSVSNPEVALPLLPIHAWCGPK